AGHRPRSAAMSPSRAAPGSTPLSVTGLRVEEHRTGVPIIDEVDLDVPPGEILGLVGETGSGKTTLGLALLRYARPGLRIGAGQVLLGGTDILGLPAGRIRALRGGTVAYVPQAPDAALNPALRIGTQLRECLPRAFEQAGHRIREVL